MCELPDGTLSNFFLSNSGLHQGENLYPILFSIYLNDLKDFLVFNVSDLTLPMEESSKFFERGN